jgi:uncharacterized spore protein YtfJ
MDAQSLLRRVGESLSVTRAFGEPVEGNGFLVIPVALVVGGGGGGEGPMPSPTTDTSSAEAANKAVPADGENATDVPPTGSGGGLGGLIFPMGVYVVRGDKVVWKPAVQPILMAPFVLAFVRLVLKVRRRAK